LYFTSIFDFNILIIIEDIAAEYFKYAKYDNIYSKYPINKDAEKRFRKNNIRFLINLYYSNIFLKRRKCYNFFITV